MRANRHATREPGHYTTILRQKNMIREQESYPAIHYISVSIVKIKTLLLVFFNVLIEYLAPFSLFNGIALNKLISIYDKCTLAKHADG
jgi:hypothetical protein